MTCMKARDYLTLIKWLDWQRGNNLAQFCLVPKFQLPQSDLCEFCGKWGEYEEPVWKPYDLDSLREDNFTFGREVVMRQKFIAKEPARIYTVIYLGHSENAENLNDVEILLGNTWFSVQRLFDDFEIFDDNYGTIGQPEWRPFGYQE